MEKVLFKMTLIKTILKVIVVLCLAYVLFALSIAFLPHINNYFNRTDFESVSWKKWKESENEPSLRWNMVSDLENNYKIIGMNLKEVENLLGKPDSSDNKNLYYYLGMSGYGIDTGNLTLTYVNNEITNFKVSHN